MRNIAALIKAHVVLTAVLSLALLAGVSIVVMNARTPTVVSERTLSVGVYHSGLPSESSVISFSEPPTTLDTSLDIRFRMNVRAITNYNNVFQTDTLNRGVRMELTPSGALGMVVSDGTSEGCHGFLVADKMHFGRWYTVHILISEHKRVKVYLDGKKAVDTIDHDINYRIGDIAVGAGFNKTRVFDGQIRDFTLTYRLITAHRVMPRLGVAWLLAFLAAIAVWFATRKAKWGGELSRGMSAVMAPPQAVRPRLEVFGLTVIVGFFASVLYHYMQGFYQGQTFPYNTFLFMPIDRFNDLFNVLSVTIGGDPYYARASQFGNYFPFTYMVAYVFVFIKDVWRLKVFLGLFVGFHLYCIWKLLAGYGRESNQGNLLTKATTVIIMTCMSYPVLFELDRANFESMVFIFLGLFVMMYLSGKCVASALFLSMAIAMKGYPLVFCVVFLYEKRYREIVITAVSVILITVGSMALLKGGVGYSYEGLRHGLETFNASYLSGDVGIRYNSSLHGVLKYALAGGYEIILSLKEHYFAICIVLFTAVTLYILYIEKELWKVLMLLCSMAILLPHISFNYKLINLGFPIALFFVNPHVRRTDVVYAFLLGLMLVPKEYYGFLKYQPVSVVLNQVILSAIVLMIIIEGFMRQYTRNMTRKVEQ